MVEIDNEIDSEFIDNIPQTVYGRREYLLEFLSQFIGISVYNVHTCKEFFISKESIEETAHHAAKSECSTIAAMNIISVLKNAELVSCDKPKSNRQISLFRFKKMLELRVMMRYVGSVKLMVGLQGRRNYLEYCITSQ